MELVQLSDDTLETWYESDPLVAKHRPWIEHIRVFKPHFLSEPVESALTKRSPFDSSSWGEFFDEVEADLEFNFRGATQNLTEMLHLLTESKDAEERAEAMKCVNDGLGGPFAKYSAQTLYMVAGSKAVEDKERGYAHPMDFRNKANRIPDSVVDVLHNARHHAGRLADAAILQIEGAPPGASRAPLERSQRSRCRLPIPR